MPEIPPAPTGPPMWQRTRDFLGLDFEAPKGAVENLEYSYGVFPFVREQVGRIMSISDTER